MRVFGASLGALALGLVLAPAVLGAAEGPGLPGPATPAPPKPPAGKPVVGKPPPGKGRKPAAGGARWLPLEEGLAKVRSELLPAAVFYHGATPLRAAGEAPPAEGTGEAASAAKAAAMEAVLRDPVVLKMLRKMVVLEIGPDDLKTTYPAPPHEKTKEKEAAKGPDGAGVDAGAESAPPDVGSRLGIFAERPSVVILDFRERVVQRFEDELPTRHKLSKELERILKVQLTQAAEARRAEKAMADARYAAGLGKQREAVIVIRPFEEKDLQTRLEPVTLGRVNALIGEFRDLAKKGMQAADKLESQRKFTEAIQAYDAVAAKFPFQDLIQHCSKRKGEILRKMTYGF